MCVCLICISKISAPVQFHLETAKRRAQQRMREGRAKPIDALAVNLFLMEEFDVNTTAPYSVFIGLSLEDVEELLDDIKGYQVRAACSHWYFACSTASRRNTPLVLFCEVPDAHIDLHPSWAPAARAMIQSLASWLLRLERKSRLVSYLPLCSCQSCSFSVLVREALGVQLLWPLAVGCVDDRPSSVTLPAQPCWVTGCWLNSCLRNMRRRWTPRTRCTRSSGMRWRRWRRWSTWRRCTQRRPTERACAESRSPSTAARPAFTPPSTLTSRCSWQVRAMVHADERCAVLPIVLFMVPRSCKPSWSPLPWLTPSMPKAPEVFLHAGWWKRTAAHWHLAQRFSCVGWHGQASPKAGAPVDIKDVI